MSVKLKYSIMYEACVGHYLKWQWLQKLEIIWQCTCLFFTYV